VTFRNGIHLTRKFLAQQLVCNSLRGFFIRLYSFSLRLITRGSRRLGRHGFTTRGLSIVSALAARSHRSASMKLRD
jgi:hypothetical protein